MIDARMVQFKVHNHSNKFFRATNHAGSYFRLGILLIFFLSQIRVAPAQEYNFHTFSEADGLVQPFIYSISQDAQGYLWIGTGNGLFKFNGFNFNYYSTRDSLADNFVCCSIKDGIRVWFGHWNGMVSFYEGNKFHPVNYQIGRASCRERV
jgi:hypothetical protein